MSFAEAGGARLYYEVYGAGEPLVLLHGNGDTTGYFKYQIPAFSARYRVIAIDTRAHGRSTRGGGPLNFARLADDVCAVLDAAGEQSAHFLGFSDGGNTAVTLALRNPARVRSLILNGANLFPRGLHPLFQGVVAVKWAAGMPLSLFCEDARRKTELCWLMLAHPQIAPEQLAEIPAPTLVIAGEHDLILGEHTALIAKSIPGAKLRILPRTGHCCAQERPVAFNKTVLDFLAGLR